MDVPRTLKELLNQVVRFQQSYIAFGSSLYTVGFCCREVQRILMELLNQMDGFDQTVNVKVIMATNRADTLDPALLRPGRLDRKIEFPLPDRRQKRLVFQVCCSASTLQVDTYHAANEHSMLSFLLRSLHAMSPKSCFLICGQQSSILQQG